MNEVFVSIDSIEFSDAIELQDIINNHDEDFSELDFYRLDGSYIDNNTELDDDVLVYGSRYDDWLKSSHLPAILDELFSSELNSLHVLKIVASHDYSVQLESDRGHIYNTTYLFSDTRENVYLFHSNNNESPMDVLSLTVINSTDLDVIMSWILNNIGKDKKFNGLGVFRNIHRKNTIDSIATADSKIMLHDFNDDYIVDIMNGTHALTKYVEADIRMYNTDLVPRVDVPVVRFVNELVDVVMDPDKCKRW